MAKSIHKYKKSNTKNKRKNKNKFKSLFGKHKLYKNKLSKKNYFGNNNNVFLQKDKIITELQQSLKTYFNNNDEFFLSDSNKPIDRDQRNLLNYTINFECENKKDNENYKISIHSTYNDNYFIQLYCENLEDYFIYILILDKIADGILKYLTNRTDNYVFNLFFILDDLFLHKFTANLLRSKTNNEFLGIIEQKNLSKIFYLEKNSFIDLIKRYKTSCTGLKSIFSKQSSIHSDENKNNIKCIFNKLREKIKSVDTIHCVVPLHYKYGSLEKNIEMNVPADVIETKKGSISGHLLKKAKQYITGNKSNIKSKDLDDLKLVSYNSDMEEYTDNYNKYQNNNIQQKTQQDFDYDMI